MKRLPGKKLMSFSLYGTVYQVREVPRGHETLDDGTDTADDVKAMVFLEDRVIYIQSRRYMTLEQQQTALAHEVEHIVEDHCHIQHSEENTDRISLGWLYIIRGCPDVVTFLKKKESRE